MKDWLISIVFFCWALGLSQSTVWAQINNRYPEGDSDCAAGYECYTTKQNLWVPNGCSSIGGSYCGQDWISPLAERICVNQPGICRYSLSVIGKYCGVTSILPWCTGENWSSSGSCCRYVDEEEEPPPTCVCDGWVNGACNQGICVGTNQRYQSQNCVPAWCELEERCVADPACGCSPVCNAPFCGQDDGCGGTCPSTDAGIPATPFSRTPALNATVNVTSETDKIQLSWPVIPKAEKYMFRSWPSPTSTICTTLPSVCIMMTTWFDYPTDWSAFSFVPLYPGYDFQLRALNSSCGTEASLFEETQFLVNGQISGTVREGAGAMIGGKCTGSGSVIQPDSGSIVSINSGVYTGAVNGDGT